MGLPPFVPVGVENPTTAFTYGDALALLSPVDPADGGGRTVDVREAATGEPRASFDTDEGHAWVGTWGGAPALYVTHEEVSPSDGLSQEVTSIVVEGYDPDGELIDSISYELPVDHTDVAVVDGIQLTTTFGEGNRGTVTATTADAETVVEDMCPDEDGCVPVAMDAQGAPAALPVVAGDVVLLTERVLDSDGVSDHERLLAYDLSEKAPLWTSEDIQDQAPAGTYIEPNESYEDVNYAVPTVVGIHGESLALQWPAGEDGDVWTLALHDPATGARGVTVDLVLDSATPLVTDADESVAVAAHSETGVAAFDLGSGKVLWTQGEDEKELTPQSIVNGVLYGTTAPDDLGLAADVTDKEILVPDLGDGALPTPIPDGYGYLTNDEGTFVFGPA